MRLDAVTLIVPYYRNPRMLEIQAREWAEYPDRVSIVVVDDASPEPALDVLTGRTLPRLSVYRVHKDIPWNRGGARNLGATVAKTDWIVHVDIDHLLPAGCAAHLFEEEINPGHWYRFARFRRGCADETRKKDEIPDHVEFGEIKPHIDSYLVRRKHYWSVGGYDEDYTGCLGGGSPFLGELTRKCGEPKMLSKNTFLCVYTRHACPDASDTTLSRDTSEYSRRRRDKQRRGNTKPTNPLRFEWSQVL